MEIAVQLKQSLGALQHRQAPPVVAEVEPVVSAAAVQLRQKAEGLKGLHRGRALQGLEPIAGPTQLASLRLILEKPNQSAGKTGLVSVSTTSWPRRRLLLRGGTSCGLSRHHGRLPQSELDGVGGAGRA